MVELDEMTREEYLWFVKSIGSALLKAASTEEENERLKEELSRLKGTSLNGSQPQSRPIGRDIPTRPRWG